jgi:tRNA(adenine34) deaminase
MNIRDFEWQMHTALEMAQKAYKLDEVPVGAVILNEHGELLASAHNEKEKDFDPTGHAEILAIQRAAQKIQSWRLSDCTIFVTLEPCPMCLSAMVQARIGTCVFGAYDKKGGALSLGYAMHQDKRLNHNFRVVGGVQHWSCSQILSRYFKEKRQEYKFKKS